ncbi:uncharacterized protein Dere_GG27163, partial [Drosophila erecta]
TTAPATAPATTAAPTTGSTSSSKKKKTIVHYKRKIHRPAKRRTIRHSRKGKGRKKSSNKTESRRN